MLIVFAACSNPPPSDDPLEVKNKCNKDDDCPGKQACQKDSLTSCLCLVGRRGATCATNSDCPSGLVCSPLECGCVDPDGGAPQPGSDAGLPPGETDAGVGEDSGSGPPQPKPCTTKDDCKRECDCDGNGSMECTYRFACEKGFCYEAPPKNGYSYAACVGQICNVCE